MKLTKYALMAAGCAMFAACSSDEPVQDEAVNPNAPAEAAAGEGYVAIEIKLPQVAGLGGRADEYKPSYTYDQGTDQEYAVANGYLIVFEGTTEANSKVVCTVPLTGMSWGTPANGYVTRSSTAIAKLSGVSVTGDQNYTGVVVLNFDSNFPMPAVGDSYATWSTTASNCSMQMTVDGKTYLTMTNAALLDGATPKVLTPINKAAIQETEAKALNEKAATFYVQRAVAKVSTKFAANYTPTGEDYKQDKVAILGWMCDITNKTTYPVQVTDGLVSDFPAIWSTNYFKSIETDYPNRVFWGKDPNYSNIAENETSKYFNEFTTADLNNIGNPTCQYVLENTFDVDDQMTWETTRVIIRANYTPAGFADGATYYRINGDAKNYDLDGVKNAIKRQISIVFKQDGTVDLGAAANTAGMYSLGDFTITINGTAATTQQLDQLAQALGLISSTQPGFYTYQSGVTYYQARIKHFGDADTPWTLGDDTYGTPGNREKWLGRYGVVRNNSYEVNINSISAPGSPIVPPIEPGPDDENNYYISVSINLLSWAARVQNVDL